MSNINVNTTELTQLLDTTPTDQNIMLVGRHGIGKSEILTEYFKAKGMKVTVLFLGQMSDPGDLIGIPHKNDVTGRTDFMPPYWFPEDGQPVVLFLDELNRARPEILQTIMDLALNRTLAGHRLPEGSRIISAVNAGTRYQITDLDPALVSRFNIVDFQPSVEEWLLWARKKNVDSRVIDFIQENKLWLDNTPDAKEDEDTGLEKTPDRRGWKKVSDMIKGLDPLPDIATKAISGIVGAKASSAFFSNLSRKRILSGKDVLLSLDNVMATLRRYEIHQLSIVNDSIFRFLETEKLSDRNKQTACTNLDRYFDFLTGEKKEAAAHFANLYVQQTYPNAVCFIATECKILTLSMIVYVKGIQ